MPRLPARRSKSITVYDESGGSLLAVTFDILRIIWRPADNQKVAKTAALLSAHDSPLRPRRTTVHQGRRIGARALTHLTPEPGADFGEYSWCPWIPGVFLLFPCMVPARGEWGRLPRCDSKIDAFRSVFFSFAEPAPREHTMF